MKTKIDHNTNVNQKIKRKFVDREIFCCVSGLFEDGIKKELFNFEEIENFYSPDDEENPQEIYEWWAVTEWLYKKLKDQGEPVYNYNDFNYFWGRTCTGQSIILDGVISDICAKMEILDGQKYMWRI